jgi:hypothetical protein
MAKLVQRREANLVEHLLPTKALWVRIQTSINDTKLAKITKEWPTHSSPPKNIQKYTATKKTQEDTAN